MNGFRNGCLFIGALEDPSLCCRKDWQLEIGQVKVVVDFGSHVPSHP